jgi:glycerol-3-phosphate dehydrogenase (NAD(P)+)
MNAFDLGPPAPPRATGPYRRVAVLGAGAWGGALAVIAARAGREVRLWTRRPDHADAMRRTRRNAAYLPDSIALPANLTPTADMAVALDGAEAVLLVTPSRAVRETAAAMASLVAPDAPVVLCAKGIEPETGLLMTEVAAQELGGNPLAALSGPNFADEAALGHPTAATIASDCGPRFGDRPEDTVAARLALTLGTESFRPYISDDLAGVEIGGAVKNVVAIACGVAEGAGLGFNTRSALITRGLDEMKQLAEVVGGRRETVTGLAGVGDLTLTCSSDRSRNMRLGLQLGRGTPRAECFDGKPVLVEGERSALSVTDLARANGLTLPLCEAVRSFLHEGVSIPTAFAALWGRPIQGEPRALDFEIGHPAADRAERHFAQVMS